MILFAERFEFERDMLPALREAVPFLFPDYAGGSGAIVREPPIGRVIPDLLLGRDVGCAHRLAKARLTVLECHMIALFQRCGATTHCDLSNAFHLGESLARRLTARLQAKGLIHIEGNTAELTSKADISRLQITALEVKMVRWREALRQASSYLSFADRAYVVLDGNQVTVTSGMKSAFIAARVGLLLQFGRMVIEVIPTTAHPVTSPERILAAMKLASGATELPPSHNFGGV